METPNNEYSKETVALALETAAKWLSDGRVPFHSGYERDYVYWLRTLAKFSREGEFPIHGATK